MPELIKTCRQCKDTFLIDKDDLAFYQKVSPVMLGKTFPIPSPTLCPQCRAQSRLVWRNEHKLYSRKCDLTGKDIISIHAPEKLYPVYSSEAWWSDDWDSLSYGKDFDFTQDFFEQFRELLESVPRAALYNVKAQNSDYNQSAGNLKNCYLLAGANHNEDCYYGNYVLNCRNCVDVHMVQNCELCYECTDCEKCYNCAFLQNCNQCTDSQFLNSCQSCRNCFGCVNLSNKEYCLFNKQYSPVEYRQKLAAFDLGKYSARIKIHNSLSEFLQTQPVRYMNGSHNEGVSGDCISYSKNTYSCFDTSHLENCKYCVFFQQAKDCMDVFAWGTPAERCYYCMEVGGGTYNMLFSVTCFSSHNLLYCFQCHNCNDCFGCSGLKKKQYCVFNKQYTKIEYEALVAKIIAHMQLTKEWGEFFPLSFSGFGYNETIASEQMVSDKTTILARGGLWIEDEQINNSPTFIADSIHDIDDGILQEKLNCEICHRSYRIISQELSFYKNQSLPVPRHCFLCRHLARLTKRNPQRLWERNCSQCGKCLKTAVSSNNPRPLYCEDCYQRLVY